LIPPFEHGQINVLFHHSLMVYSSGTGSS
jgi:hypothetical protein